jgi:hypothetical protein
LNPGHAASAMRCPTTSTLEVQSIGRAHGDRACANAMMGSRSKTKFGEVDQRSSNHEVIHERKLSLVERDLPTLALSRHARHLDRDARRQDVHARAPSRGGRGRACQALLARSALFTLPARIHAATHTLPTSGTEHAGAGELHVVDQRAVSRARQGAGAGAGAAGNPFVARSEVSKAGSSLAKLTASVA